MGEQGCLFEKCDVRYRVNGGELRRRRLAIDKTLEQVAYACGWSHAYQWQLENGVVKTVCDETKRVVETALEVLAAEACQQ